MKTEQLYSEGNSKQFYDERYDQGYMDEWPLEKKQRVSEVVRSLGLPERGVALDFGCGNGVFTEVLQKALPDWQIYGTDISSVALQHAAERVPGAVFFEAGQENRRFDFLFTHHVFEHVYNLESVWRQAVEFMKPQSGMLHILPCGNEGSLEHRICLLRNDGINREMEDRFFFEDTGHVRRLNTRQFTKMAQQSGFTLAKEYYSNQHDGALNWITQYEPSFVRMLTDPSKAKDEAAKKELTAMQRKLLAVSVMRDLRRRVTSFPARKKNVKTWIGLLAGLPAYPVASILERSMKRKAELEWERKKNDPSGSEMYLYFTR